MTLTSRTFRVFVSSTFSDLKAERNALQEQVFPRLRALAAAHGCRFQAIDLRWGVSEEAALDQQTMQICLGEIERCQKVSPRPNFIVLLGDRYGWRPLPYEIPASEFGRIVANLTDRGERLVVESWYRRDDNAVPPVYCLQARTDEFIDPEKWASAENTLHNILEREAGKIRLSQEEFRKYTASATEQEIILGALSVPDAQGHVFGFFREIEGLPTDESSKDFRDTDEVAYYKQAELKKHLKDKLSRNIHEYQAVWLEESPSQHHIDQFCKDVYAELSKVILTETSHLENLDPLDKEVKSHEDFGMERAKVFVGRADFLKTISDHINGDNPHVLAIWGASGSGKSALMAKAMEQAQEKGGYLFYRFIGATPESSNGRDLLERLCRQITRFYGVEESTIPSEYKALVQEFPRCLALATREKPLILLLDALDQLSARDNARSLIWLPADLPPNVRLIVSTLPGDCLKILESKLPEANLVEMRSLSMEDGKVILSAWFEDAQRKLQEFQEQYLLEKFKLYGLPLYLKLAFEEARSWKSYDALPELCDDIPGILGNLFKRLSLESNHGGMLVSRSLAYLAAAKNGLSEDELLNVLSLDEEMLADFQRRSPRSPKVDHLPFVIWSRLYFDLEPYLSERAADGTTLFSFYHRQLSEVVAAEYLAGEARSKRHQVLAQYFGSQSLYVESAGDKNPNLRKLSEMAHQQAQAGLATELMATLTDIDILYEKSASLGAQAAVEDFELVDATALQASTSLQECKADLRLIQSAMQLAAPLVSVQAGLLPGQLAGRLVSSQQPLIQDFLQHVRAWHGSDWLEPLTASLASAGGPLKATLMGHAYIINDVLVTPDGKRTVSAGGDWTVGVWDLTTGERVHTVKGMAGPVTALALTQDGRYVVAGALGGTNGYLLALWDVQTGTLVQAFEGHAENVLAVRFTQDDRGAYSATEDGLICSWSLSRPAPIQTIQVDPIACLAFSPDGRTIALQPKLERLEPSRISIRELPNAEQPSTNLPFETPGTGTIFTLYLQTEGTATLMAFTPNGRQLVSVHPGKQPATPIMHIWDAGTGQEIHTLTGHTAKIKALDFHPDGSRMYTGAEDGTLRVWDLIAGRLLSTLTVCKEVVTAIKATRDGKTCLVGTSAGAISIWDLEKNVFLGLLPGHTNSISQLVFTPDERSALSAAQDYSLKIWDWRLAGQDVEDNLGHATSVKALVLSLDNQLGYSAAQDGSLRIWDLTQAKILSTLRAPASPVVLSPQGSGQVWIGCEDGTLLNLNADKPVLLPAGKIPASGHMAFAEWADGRLLYCVQGMDLHILDPDNGQKIGELESTHNAHTLWDLACTPNGGIVAGVYWDGSLDVWDGMSGRLRNRMRSQRPLLRLAVTPDGSRAITGSNNGELSLWDLTKGQMIRTWQAYTGTGDTSWIKSLAISPDAAWAVSGANDRITKLWGLPRGELIAWFAGESEISKCALSADGQIILAGEISGRVHLLKYNHRH